MYTVFQSLFVWGYFNFLFSKFQIFKFHVHYKFTKILFLAEGFKNSNFMDFLVSLRPKGNLTHLNILKSIKKKLNSENSKDKPSIHDRNFQQVSSKRTSPVWVSKIQVVEKGFNNLSFLIFLGFLDSVLFKDILIF